MREIAASLYTFVNNYLYWLHMPRIGVVDIIEILLIAIFLYYLIKLIKTTRAWTLFKGILVILIFVCIAAIFQMNTILWLFGKLLNFGVIALLIIFQPELRRALEKIGKSPLFNNILRFYFLKSDEGRLFSEKTRDELVTACVSMSAAKTGALIVIERKIFLDEYIKTGIRLDSEISSGLLVNIFEHNTPLHDGAVIMREDRLAAATCILPLTDNRSLSKELGTRHRAAVGISEVSDSVTIVVSEETGAISIAEDRILRRNLTKSELWTYLEKIAVRDQKQKQETYINKLKRRRNDGKEDSKDLNE